MSDKKKYKSVLQELSNQYLGKFFEDSQERGVFQIIDCIKEPGYVFASNGVKTIKRQVSQIKVYTSEGK